MRIITIADLHFISDRDPARKMVHARQMIAVPVPLFRELAMKINASSPDLIVLLGDLVDWYSPENRDFALEMLTELKAPWHAVPGNHDFEGIRPTAEGWGWVPSWENYAVAKPGWRECGVVFRNRTITEGQVVLCLMNSAFSDVPPGTAEWLDRSVRHDGMNLLFTHVPLDTPENRTAILTREPYRDMNKYVQSKAPGLYTGHVQDRFSHVFSGHLHVPYVVPHGRMTCHILGHQGVTVIDVGLKGVELQLIAIE